MNKTYARVFAYIVGLIIQSVGLSLIIRSDFGTGPWDGFYVGISNHSGLTVGSWLFVVGILLVFFNSYLIKSKPNFISLITIFIMGLCMDCCLYLLDFEPDQAEMQVLTFWAGLLLTSIGMSLYVQGKFAITPADQLMYALSHRFRLSLMWSKTLTDMGALMLAFLLHGPIGFGTIIYTFLCGPFIQFFIPKFERFFTQKT
ncbi:hypothetical protein SAMN05421852_106129 [Thermoflavimicrobium dichotomicum]|uniref:Membrane protein YczE n=2 Tax=Thermoflavimicrobium dichotomicum TaxID=46223 RepID=A0A1I3PV36_9BACL|nr:hypothetical protein SAMN05421852_106129 [Thermoflavimicrobium dichotomicum]